jgi:hypothetical protein
MAYKEMTVVKIGTSEKEEYIYEAQDSVNVNTTAGTTIILPAGVTSCGVTVKVGAGATVKCQASSDSINDLKTDAVTNTWEDWPLGEITADDQDELAVGASAVRLYCVATAGVTSTIKVSAK